MNFKIKYTRKQILVERGIQFRFARFVTFFSICTAVVTSVAAFWMAVSLLGERLMGVYPQGRLIETFQTVYVRFGFILAISIPIIFYLSVRFSHHFVGPLPKMYEILRRIGEGHYNERVHLRQRDELHELGQAINQMAEKLEKRSREHSS